jgi:hypothetical protein
MTAVPVAECPEAWAFVAWRLRSFESRLSHGCLSSFFCVVLSCVGKGLCDGLITRPGVPWSVCEVAKVLPRNAEPRRKKWSVQWQDYYGRRMSACYNKTVVDYLEASVILERLQKSVKSLGPNRWSEHRNSTQDITTGFEAGTPGRGFTRQVDW